MNSGKIYKNRQMNLGKIQNLGDVTIFGLNCDFVCAIVNPGRNENVSKKYLGF